MYSFIQLSQLGPSWRERKCPIFETVAKRDSNLGYLDLRVRHSTTELPRPSNSSSNIIFTMYLSSLLVSTPFRCFLYNLSGCCASCLAPHIARFGSYLSFSPCTSFNSPFTYHSSFSLRLVFVVIAPDVCPWWPVLYTFQFNLTGLIQSHITLRPSSITFSLYSK